MRKLAWFIPLFMAVCAAADEAPASMPVVLDLSTAKVLALRDNPSLQAAAARVDQGLARVKQARSAFLPSADISASASNTWLDENSYRALKNQAMLSPLMQNAIPAPGQPALMTQFNTFNSVVHAYADRGAVDDDISMYSAALTVQWLLFDGCAREFNYMAAKYGAKEVEAGLHETKRMLLRAVAGGYHAAALGREEVAIAEADKAFNQRLLKEAEARRRVGLGSLSDELNFKVRANLAEASLIRARQNHQTALIALAALLGLPEGRLPEGTVLAPLDEEMPQELELPAQAPLVTYALEHRPDVALNRHTVSRTHSTAKAQWGAFLPTVGVSASKNATSQSDAHLGQDDFSTTVGLSVSQTLFAGGRNRARLHEAKAAHAEAKHTLTSAEIAATSDVRTAVERLAASQEQLILQRANATLVQKNRDLVEKEYGAGQASLVRLNEAQKDLIAAQGQLALARVGLRQAWQELDAATGEIVE